MFFSNFVPKMHRFWDIRLQKCRDLENRVRVRQGLHCCSRSPIQLYITCHHTQGTCSVTVSTPSDLPIQVFPYSAQRPPRPRQEIERIRPNHVLNWLIKTTKTPSTWQLKSQANNYCDFPVGHSRPTGKSQKKVSSRIFGINSTRNDGTDIKTLDLKILG